MGSSGAVGPIRRAALDRNADAATLLKTIANVASCIDADAGAAWGVAVPGPFDYEAGIGRYHGVGKFGALSGVDVGAALMASDYAGAMTGAIANVTCGDAVD